MGVLKWIGYLVAAIVVLTVVVGCGLFVAAVVAIGGALLCLMGLVLLIASSIKAFCEEVLPQKGK